MLMPAVVISWEGDNEEDASTAKMKILCGSRASLGPELVLMSSETVSQTMQKKLKNSFKIDASYLKAVTAAAHVDDVESIEASIVNARIISLTDADVLENLKNRSEPCRQAIAARLEQGYSLTMISQSLVADFQFKVTWKSEKNVNKKARLLAQQRLASELGGGMTRVGLRTIDSQGLVLGIRTDAFLLALSSPTMNGISEKTMETASKERSGEIKRVEADTDPIAPYVLPRGTGGAGQYLHPNFDPTDE